MLFVTPALSLLLVAASQMVSVSSAAIKSTPSASASCVPKKYYSCPTPAWNPFTFQVAVEQRASAIVGPVHAGDLVCVYASVGLHTGASVCVYTDVGTPVVDFKSALQVQVLEGFSCPKLEQNCVSDGAGGFKSKRRAVTAEQQLVRRRQAKTPRARALARQQAARDTGDLLA